MNGGHQQFVRAYESVAADTPLADRKIELVRRFDDKVVCRIPCLSFDDGARKLGSMLDADHRFGDWREHYARECEASVPNLSLWSTL